MKNFILFIVFIITPTISFGAKLFVTNTNDTGAGSLRNQIANSFPGDTVFIDVSGTMMITSQIEFFNDVVIIGPGPIHFNIDGTNLVTPLSTGFVAHGNQSVLIEGIGFENFSHDPFATGGTFTGEFKVKRCLFHANSATINVDGGNMVLEACSFMDNAGAYVLFVEANLNMVNCTFSGNTHGAVLVNNGSTQIVNCTFYENGFSIPTGKAIGQFGGILTLRNNIIFNDTQSDALIEISAGTLISQGGNITNDLSTTGMPVGSDIENISLNAGISFANAVTDGWGLRYFPPSLGSDGINIDNNPSGLPLYDQRSVWRVMDDGFGNVFADAGAVEYTPLVVTQSGMGAGSFDNNVQNTYSSLNGKKAFVFEISGVGPFSCPQAFAPFTFFDDSVIVNGFSQNNSVVPGPGATQNSVTPGYTPIIVEKGIGNSYGGFQLYGNDITIAGVSIGGYGGFGAFAIETQGFRNEISGCHIGVDATGMTRTVNNVGVIITFSATTKIGAGHYCGHLYHNNRNVISGNEWSQISSSSDAEQIIRSNIIGLNAVGNNRPNGTIAFGDTGIVFHLPLSTNYGSTIGGAHWEDRNIIGDQTWGVYLESENNKVFSNVIGGIFSGEDTTAATVNDYGIIMSGPLSFFNRIGDAGMGNVIVGNYTGIAMEYGANSNEIFSNIIGMSKSGNVALGNIYEGIYLANTGTNYNKIGDVGIENYIGNNGDGINLYDEASYNEIFANYVGFSADGNFSAMGNNYSGIKIQGYGTNHNIIGKPLAGNVIGNNQEHGVFMYSDSYHSIIQGNYIGFKPDGVTPAGNLENGITTRSYSDYNLIGGCGPDAGNLIGYNSVGIAFENFGADYDTVVGNKIGMNINGNPAGNIQHGVYLVGAASYITIGQSSPGCGNEIAFNGGAGISLDADYSYENIFSGNSIHDNISLGIDLDNNGTPDYNTDFGLMSNDEASIGVVTQCFSCGGNTSFTITPENNNGGPTTYEVFIADGDSEEGDSLIFVWTGVVDYLIDTTIIMPFPLAPGTQLVMTATKYGESTSEFGPAFTVAGPPSALTPILSSNSICVDGTTPMLSTTGEIGTPVWFADAGLTIYVHTGNNYTLEPSFASVPSSYTFYVVDSVAGCYGDVSSPITLTVTAPPAITFSSPNEVCEGSGHTYDATVSGLSPFIYNWQNSADFVDNTIEDASTIALLPGSYIHNLIVTDANGCIDSNSVTLDVYPTPNEGNQFITDVICAGGFNGDISIAPPGTYSHSWTGPNGFTANSQNISGLEAGSYTNTMTDISTGCIGTYIGVVGEPSPITYSVVTTNVSCAGGSDGSITFTAAGGVAPYQYSTDGGFAFQSPATFNGLVAGNISCVVQDATGCLANSVEPITEPTALVVSAVVTSNYNGSDISCFGLSDGEMTGTVFGGTAGYTYQWFNGASLIAGETLPTLSNQVASSYSLEVTDANGCTDMATVSLLNPSQVASDAGLDITYCSGSAVTLGASGTGGTGTLTYLWTPSTGLSDPNIATPVASPTVTTNYTLSVTDINGCTQSDGLLVTVNVIPTFTGWGIDPLCNGGTDGQISIAAASGTAPFQYSNNGGGSYTTSTVFSSLSPGSYICNIMDANTCVSADSTIIINDPLSIVIGQTIKEDTCSKVVGEIEIFASNGNSPYLYSINNGGNFVSSNVFSNLSAANYNLLVQDANGCQSVANTITLNDIGGVTIADAGSSTQVSCFGMMDANLGVTETSDPFGVVGYNWTSGGSSVGTTSSLLNMGPGNYTVVVTDNGGCVDSLSFIVAEPTQVTGVFSQVDISCDGLSDGQVELSSVSGGTGTGYTYTWEVNDGGGVIISTNSLVANLPYDPNGYLGTVYDSDGCSFGGGLLLAQGESYTPNVVVSNLPDSCDLNSTYDFGDDNNVPPSGAVSFNWSFSGGTPSVSSAQNPTGIQYFTPGNYTVNYSVTSNNGCVFTDLMTVNVANPPSVDVGLDQTICEGNSTTLFGTPNGGGFSYSWEIGLSGGSVVGTTADVVVSPTASLYYVLYVTEAATGCVGSDSLTVLVNPTPNPSIDQIGPLTFCETQIGNYVSLSATSSDIPAGTFSWYVGSTASVAGNGATFNIDNSNVGNHYIYVTESNGACDSEADSILLDFIPSDLTAGVDGQFCIGELVNLNASGSGTITWVNSGGEISDTLSGITTANPISDNSVYYAEMDFNGCVFSDSVVFTIDPNCINEEITVNAFSPDGDGVNDIFKLDIPLLLQNDNNVIIVNRWGDVIREFQNYNNADVVWDGTGKSGDFVTNGTYYYIVEIPEINLRESGWIQVVR